MNGNKKKAQSARGCFGGSKPGKKKAVYNRSKKKTETLVANPTMKGTLGIKIFKRTVARTVKNAIARSRFNKKRGFVPVNHVKNGKQEND